VLSPVGISPEDDLSTLRQAIESAFEWKSEKPYFPHLSLLYGDLSKERRDELAGKVNEGMALPTSTEIKEIAIVDCTGTADQWRTVGTVKLGPAA
jgi:2'-5' RNA ligase